MKNSLRRFKIRLFLELSLQIVGAILLLLLGLRLVDGILNDFIANFLFSLDSDLYRFCVRNKAALLFLIGSGTIMIVIYFTIRKTSNYLEQIITSINQVFNKDENLVVLPTDFKEIENQLNSIKFETLRSEQAQQQEQQMQPGTRHLALGRGGLGFPLLPAAGKGFQFFSGQMGHCGGSL